MNGGRIAGAPNEKSVDAGEEDSAEEVLVWNGMVESIHRIPCDDAPASTSTRPAEATQPIPTRPPA